MQPLRGQPGVVLCKDARQCGLVLPHRWWGSGTFEHQCMLSVTGGEQSGDLFFWMRAARMRAEHEKTTHIYWYHDSDQGTFLLNCKMPAQAGQWWHHAVVQKGSWKKTSQQFECVSRQQVQQAAGKRSARELKRGNKNKGSLTKRDRPERKRQNKRKKRQTCMMDSTTGSYLASAAKQHTKQTMHVHSEHCKEKTATHV